MMRFACVLGLGALLALPRLAVYAASELKGLSHIKTHERQITRGQRGRILTNTGVWSPDSQWIVYDTRSDAAGDSFDGSTIEMVNVNTGEVRELFRSTNGAHCGVATFHPGEHKVVFIHGPENPTKDWQYGPFHRHGVVVEVAHPGRGVNLDARDLTPPFTPGALRGGSHVHVWDAKGEWVSFTYEDHVLAQVKEATATNDINQRNIGVSVPMVDGLRVTGKHPRNHDGSFFTALATRTTPSPKPGSDEISRACEEAWVGTNGYLRADGTRQKRAVAFQGQVAVPNGGTIYEVFLIDLPEDLRVPGDGPLAGTETRMPFPPKNVKQQRLTYSADRKFPGVQGPRHWLRSSPDGSRIAFLAKDNDGIVQFWTVSPKGGPAEQLTRNPWPVASAFSWSPDGAFLACVMDGSIFLTDAQTGQARRLTSMDAESPPRPEACVFSPDGKSIAYVRRIKSPGETCNQIYTLRLDR